MVDRCKVPECTEPCRRRKGTVTVFELPNDIEDRQSGLLSLLHLFTFNLKQLDLYLE